MRTASPARHGCRDVQGRRSRCTWQGRGARGTGTIVSSVLKDHPPPPFPKDTPTAASSPPPSYEQCRKCRHPKDQWEDEDTGGKNLQTVLVQLLDPPLAVSVTLLSSHNCPTAGASPTGPGRIKKRPDVPRTPPRLQRLLPPPFPILQLFLHRHGHLTRHRVYTLTSHMPLTISSIQGWDSVPSTGQGFKFPP